MMDMPTPCNLCGATFDLNDGNPCDCCELIYCNDCLEEPFEICPACLDCS